MNELTSILLILGFGFTTSCTQHKGFDREITHHELRTHVDLLSSDSLQGRLPGTPFDRVAAKYIKDQFEFSGIKLIGKNGYQFFDFIAKQEAGPNNALTIGNEKLKHKIDFTAFPFSSNDSLSSSVVFVGYGFSINSDSFIWDDYQSVNVSGKWVLILRGDPDSKNSESPFIPYVADRFKAMVAKDQGALGVILVSGTEFDSSDELVSMSEKDFDVGIPVIHVTRVVAEKILRSSGFNVLTLEKKFVSIPRPSSFAIKLNVAARTDVMLQKRATQNVIGLIEGTHPMLKHQYIVVGAHFDHLGLGGKGTSSRMPDTIAVHNGADDNASGVASMLEIAQKLAGNQQQRSILLVAFGAEELGLLGSRYFVENPLVPTDSIVAMINIDMVGRLSPERSIQIGGVKTSIESEGIIDKISTTYNFNIAKSPEGYGPSDHASFYGKNIPVFFITTGPHTDYHTPNDKIGSINFEGLVDVSKFISSLVSDLASLPHKLSFQEAGPKASPTRHGRDLKVRLGIMPDVSGTSNNGLRVIAVTENNPAWVAGIKKDDIIIAINGQSIGNVQDYMFRLKDLKPRTTITVEVKRNGEPKVFLVQL
jgi:hypothetical protein